MATIKIPSGILVRAPQKFTPALLLQAILDFTYLEPEFTGFISVATDEVLYFLFFFSGTPYSAGKSIGEKPFAMSLRDFLREMGGLAQKAEVSFSIHATDPVLLKCLLVFIQDDVTAKAPINLINLESMLAQMQHDGRDSLIILEKAGMFNFFFFKDGVKGKSYFADSEFLESGSLPVDEQMLVYAFQGGNVEVDVLVYRNLITCKSGDSETLSQDEISALLGVSTGKTALSHEATTILEADIVKDEFTLAVLDGPSKGQIFSASTPCVIGRKDSDFVIPDPMISKTHAVFEIVNGVLLLVDLNSTNGTAVNGENVNRREIAVGDIIAIGGTTIKVLQLKR